MKCSEVMTRELVCCLPTDSLDQVAKVMQSADIGPVPIVEDRENLELVGLVTDRDLVLRAVALGLHPRETQVESVMTRDLITCLEDEDVENALDLMAQHQVRRLPIVDEDDKLIGIISQADVATRLHERERVAQVVEQISKPRA